MKHFIFLSLKHLFCIFDIVLWLKNIFIQIKKIKIKGGGLEIDKLKITLEKLIY